MEEFSKHLFKEEAIPYLSNNASVSQCMNVRKGLQKKKNTITNNIRDLSGVIVQFFNKTGLTKNTKLA